MILLNGFYDCIDGHAGSAYEKLFYFIREHPDLGDHDKDVLEQIRKQLASYSKVFKRQVRNVIAMTPEEFEYLEGIRSLRRADSPQRKNGPILGAAGSG